MSESSSLPLISKLHKDDVKRFEAFAEEKEVEFKRCSHKGAAYDKEKGELRCKCGCAWAGPRIHELEKALNL